MAAEEFLERDGWWQEQSSAYSVSEAANCGDAQKVRELVQAAGVTETFVKRKMLESQGLSGKYFKLQFSFLIGN